MWRYGKLSATLCVTSSPVPTYTAQAHSPLELSSSLRSKRLTEDYYASLALVFKSVDLTQDSRYGTKLLVALCYQLQYPAHCPSYSNNGPSANWAHLAHFWVVTLCLLKTGKTLSIGVGRLMANTRPKALTIFSFKGLSVSWKLCRFGKQRPNQNVDFLRGLCYTKNSYSQQSDEKTLAKWPYMQALWSRTWNANTSMQRLCILETSLVPSQTMASIIFAWFCCNKWITT
jgi:hypothetical protein